MKSLNLMPAPTRHAAFARLGDVLPRAATAALDRKGEGGDPLPQATGLSPWLRYRLLAEEEVLEALGHLHGAGAQPFRRAILRRAYLKGYFEMRRGLWLAYRQGLRAGLNRIATEAGLRNRWEAACQGATGVAPFDAAARALVHQGHLSDAARRAFARTWLHDLHLPWELGADLFLRHLLDGDLAITLLSWRGLAGPLPDLPPGPCPQGGIWDHGAPSALLLHEDDLSPDRLLDRGLRPDQTAFVMAPEGRSPLMVAPTIEAFIRAAMEDCATRLSPRLGTIHGPVQGEGAIDALVSWARGTRAVQIITPFAPLGPMSDMLDALETRLEAENIRLIRAMRDHDARLWPQATDSFDHFLRAVTEAG